MLRNHLARLATDTRKNFQTILAKDMTGMIKASIAYARIVYTHDMLLFCCQEADDDTQVIEDLFGMYNSYKRRVASKLYSSLGYHLQTVTNGQRG